MSKKQVREFTRNAAVPPALSRGFKDLNRIPEYTGAMYDHPLSGVLSDAFHQATEGKGRRHQNEGEAFEEQAWMRIADRHGQGFLTGQAAKKLEEAVCNSAPGTDAYRNELLGAIVYIAMAIVRADGLEDPEAMED